jgi:hypothetical protein
MMPPRAYGWGASPEPTRTMTDSKHPIHPDDERANLVWELVLSACGKAWPERKKLFYNESPIELINDIINERDEALAENKRLKLVMREALSLLREVTPGWGVAKDILNKALWGMR